MNKLIHTSRGPQKSDHTSLGHSSPLSPAPILGLSYGPVSCFPEERTALGKDLPAMGSPVPLAYSPWQGSWLIRPTPLLFLGHPPPGHRTPSFWPLNFLQQLSPLPSTTFVSLSARSFPSVHTCAIISTT
jgi:hypothetical protein